MERFIAKPSIDLYPGVRVTEDTVLEYKSENVEQKIEKLMFQSVTKVKGPNYDSEYNTLIRLNEGDVLIFEDGGRGYIKPVDQFVTIAEAIEELTNIKDLG